MVEESGAGERASGLAASIAREHHGDRADLYLDEQTRLTRLQIEQIEEENATRRHILKLERASAAMKVALELAVALVVTVIAIGLGAAIWSAATDNGLVVESFSVPPDLAGRGLTGDVIAAKLLDKLSSLQTQTISNRAASSYANNWGGDIKLQIPDTGVSIGEFVRSLHTWLGHQTRITGEVYRTPTGLAVTARTGNNTSPTFTGSDADLDKLMQQAAESVYNATQPYRYAVYLSNAGRDKEARAVYETLIANGSAQDRSWALIGLENTYANNADHARAIATLRRAAAIRPDFIMVFVNTNGVESEYGHDEISHRAMMKVVQLADGPREADMGETPWEMGTLTAKAAVASDFGDYQAQLDFDRKLETYPEFSGQVANARRNDVLANALLHDETGMYAAFDNLPVGSRPDSAVQRDGLLASAEMILGDGAAMIAMRDKVEPTFTHLGAFGVVVRDRQYWPYLALALALTGRMKEAHALIDRTPADCDQCLALRGVIDARDHNWKGAQYWYERVTRDAPSFPLYFSLWGEMLVQKGDLDGAIARLETAHEKGPNFADPLEMWGEALIAKHQLEVALPKFEEANKYAPNWGRLHLKWGEALAAVGQKDEARKQFAIADGLHLMPDEKVELAKARHG